MPVAHDILRPAPRLFSLKTDQSALVSPFSLPPSPFPIMTDFIPRDKLTAYQRWEMAAFDEAEQAAERAAEEAARQAAMPPVEPEVPAFTLNSS